MSDLDPRDGYVELISVEKSQVHLKPPIVFLFGGDISTSPPISVRGVLYNYLLVKEPALFRSLVIPEDFQDWLHDSAYPDLLLFESDLAQTSSLVIIALESPGSIAELGSFSVNAELQQKLLIVLSENHHSQKSFITLGPLRQIPENNIFAYPYSYDSVSETISDYLEDFVSNIKDSLNKINETTSFNKESNGHIALLIYECIVLFKALKLSEIQNYLKMLSVEKAGNEVKRLLFLLEKLDLVLKKRRGNVDYFLPAKTSTRIKFASKSKEKLFDKTSASLGAAQYYSASSKEKIRKKLIDEILMGGK